MSTIEQETQALKAEFRERMRREDEAYGTSFLRLFNLELVDFVRLEKDGTYTPVEWPKDATHYLRPTAWNNPKDYKVNGHGQKQMPDGYALAVCAEPMSRPARLSRGSPVKIIRPLPENAPAYKGDGGLSGKRSVLQWMVAAMRAKVTKTFLKSATSQQCDTLYRNLCVADFYLE